MAVLESRCDICVSFLKVDGKLHGAGEQDTSECACARACACVCVNAEESEKVGCRPSWRVFELKATTFDSHEK